MRKLILATVVLLVGAVQPASAGPREDQMALSMFFGVIGAIQGAVQPPGVVYVEPEYVEYRYGRYYDDPPMRYYPEPQQNTYGNWLRQNTLPNDRYLYPQQFERRPMPVPLPDYEEDDLAVAPPPPVAPYPVPVPAYPPPVQRAQPAPLPGSAAPQRGEWWAALSKEWSGCLFQAINADRTGNVDGIMGSCSGQFMPRVLASLERDGFTRPQASDWLVRQMGKARQGVVVELQKRQQGR